MDNLIVGSSDLSDNQDYTSISLSVDCTSEDLVEALEEAMGAKVSRCAAPLNDLYVGCGIPILLIQSQGQVEIRRYRSGLTLAQFIQARSAEEEALM